MRGPVLDANVAFTAPSPRACRLQNPPGDLRPKYPTCTECPRIRVNTSTLRNRLAVRCVLATWAVDALRPDMRGNFVTLFWLNFFK